MKKNQFKLIKSKKYIYKLRKKLPVFKKRNIIIDAVIKNNSLMIIGSTGSGKSTQVCQYLAEERVHGRKCIGIIQPRRMAAITLAERVAIECQTKLGKKVGYHVRFDDTTSKETCIKFITNGYF